MKNCFVILLMLLAATAARAFDFSAATPAGQTIYYTIVDATTVKAVNPDWDSHIQPSGFLALPSTVQHNGTTYHLRAIDAQAFRSCESLTGVSIPEGVTSVGRMAFAFCSSLDSIVLPSTLNEIGTMAFTGTAYYSNSAHLTPEGLMIVGPYVIASLPSIADTIVVPEGILGLGNMAFYNCEQMPKISLPTTLHFIGENAFSSCLALDTMTLLATVPPTLQSNSFIDMPDFIVAVPCGSGDAYHTAENWSTLSIVEMCPISISEVDMESFSACAVADGLLITLPDGHSCKVCDMMGRTVATMRTSGKVTLTNPGVYLVSIPSLGTTIKVIFSR
ncbi:MAG: leucine-rich repeat domain-containing protein [Bacteroidales bacterium]|nr:leucine-rich repeat domain-containing protein [Bacteroidales bacterium]